MINNKKILSLILVIVLCFSTIVVSSLSVSGDTGSMAFAFRDKDYDKSATNNSPEVLICSNDGSMRMQSNEIKQQYQMVFKVAGANKERLAEAINTACTNYDGALSMEVYVNSAKTITGSNCSPQIQVQLVGATADGKFDRSNVIADTGISKQAPEQTSFYSLDVSKYMDPSNVYDDDVKFVYVQVQCYDWGCGDGKGTMPDVTFYPIYADTGTTSETRLRPTVAPDPNQKTFFKFTNKSRNDYDNGPSNVYYSSDCSTWKSAGRATEDNYGYLKMSQLNVIQQMQVSYNYNGFEDEAKNALNVAKSEGNSGKVKFRVSLDKCVDSNGKSTIAEFSYMLTFTKGIENKAPETITGSCWQYPGTTRTYYVDISNVSHYSQLDSIVFRVQNYWYYKPDGTLFDYDSAIRAEGGTPNEQDAIAAGYRACRIKPELVISPLTVASPTEAAVNTDYKLVLNSFNANGGNVPTDPNKLKEGDPNLSDIYQDPNATEPSTTTTTAPTTTGSNNNPTNYRPTTVVVPTTNSSVISFNKTVKPVLKLTAKKKQIVLKLKKKVTGATGYQIKYSTNKKLKKAKTANLSASKKSLTIKKLKSGKKYYFRVRAYTKVNGKKVYGKWSKIVNKKVK